jgi:Icc-related predicted phosphoesterase
VTGAAAVNFGGLVVFAVMRVIHTTDVHGDFEGFERVVDAAISQSPCLLAITGDFVNWPGPSLCEDEWAEYARPIRSAGLRLLAADSALAFCSGNHEAWSAGPRAATPWQNSNSTGTYTDSPTPERCSHIVQIGDECAVVTCFPWSDDESRMEAHRTDVAECGRRLIEQCSAGCAWLWLHHNPPAGTPLAATGMPPYAGAESGSSLVALLASAYQPTAVLCGHIHGNPWCGGSPSWMDKHGVLWSNPGRSEYRVFFSVFDTRERKVRWQAAA